MYKNCMAKGWRKLHLDRFFLFSGAKGVFVRAVFKIGLFKGSTRKPMPRKSGRWPEKESHQKIYKL